MPRTQEIAIPRAARRPKYRWSKRRSLRWLQTVSKTARRARRMWPYTVLVFAAMVLVFWGLELLQWEPETSSLWSTAKSVLLNPALWMLLLLEAWGGYKRFLPDWSFFHTYRNNLGRLCPDPEVEGEAQRIYDDLRVRRRRWPSPEHLPPIIPEASGAVDSR